MTISPKKYRYESTDKGTTTQKKKKKLISFLEKYFELKY